LLLYRRYSIDIFSFSLKYREKLRWASGALGLWGRA